jgi:hypothetical protein
MAKFSRDVLKGLVKECLVEILAEGLSAARQPEAPRPRKKSQPAPRRRGPDLVSMNTDQSKQSAIEQKIKNVSGGNNILEGILRDTAQNTLPNMIAAESRSTAGMVNRTTRGDTATKAMAQADPMAIFEGASNWAALAFPDAPKK